MITIRSQIPFRNIWKQCRQIRLHSSNQDKGKAAGPLDARYSDLYPVKKEEDDLPEKFGPYDDIPEDRNRFRRRKEGFPMEWVTFMTQPIDLRPQSIRNWYRRKSHEIVVKRQSNVKERRMLYGIELGAAVFTLELNGKIRFKNHSTWTKLSETDRENGNLPLMPLRGTLVEEIDASDTILLYEGLDNLCGLRGLKTLILDNCPHIDDWCLDKLSSRMRHTLVNLKIKNCPQVTEKGLSVLPRLKHLRGLHLNNLSEVSHPGLVGILLEEAMPQCKIDGIDYETGEFIDEKAESSDSEKEQQPKLRSSFKTEKKLT